MLSLIVAVYNIYIVELLLLVVLVVFLVVLTGACLGGENADDIHELSARPMPTMPFLKKLLMLVSNEATNAGTWDIAVARPLPLFELLTAADELEVCVLVTPGEAFLAGPGSA